MGREESVDWRYMDLRGRERDGHRSYVEGPGPDASKVGDRRSDGTLKVDELDACEVRLHSQGVALYDSRLKTTTGRDESRKESEVLLQVWGIVHKPRFGGPGPKPERNGCAEGHGRDGDPSPRRRRG